MQRLARHLALNLLTLTLASPLLTQAQESAPMSLRERVRQNMQERRKANEKTSTDGLIAQPGDYSLSLEHAGQKRLYRVHIPASYKADQPTPLVLAFHGGGGNMDIQANDAYYGQISKSEQAGYIVAFPNGYSRFGGKFATWNAGNCCAAARDNNSDDVGFVRDVIQRLSSTLNIDPKRIFATGMSNGAMMSYRLACEMPDTFRAIAAVAGTDNTQHCTPSQPISILHIHARDDERELFNGGAGKPSDRVTSYVSVPDSIAKWVALDGCKPTPHRVLETPGAYCDAYEACKDGSEVKLCVTETGEHSWPGGKKPLGGAAPSTAISATDQIWAFFSSQQR
jgi:polyhydroxybutyrate depolymerase